MAFLEVENICKRYAVRGSQGKSYIQALDNVSFTLEQGEVLGIIGESGCGKSTLGRILIGLEEITSGQVRYHGTELREMFREDRRRFCELAQMVFQNPFDTFPPGQTMQNIMLRAMRIHGIGRDRAERRRLCLEALEAAGLKPAEDFIDRYPHELSGGQLQRLSIMRSMLLGPSFLVADEPVSMLDVSVRADIINLLLEITKKKNTAMVFISHDLATTRYISDRVAVVYLGRIVETGETDQVLQDPRHPYTRALLSHCASIDPLEERERISVPGEPPSVQGERRGCHFAPRCYAACERCFSQRPEMEPVGPGHYAACHCMERT